MQTTCRNVNLNNVCGLLNCLQANTHTDTCTHTHIKKRVNTKRFKNSTAHYAVIYKKKLSLDAY